MSHATPETRQREQIQFEPVTPALLDEVVGRVVAKTDPERIILFGSYAGGSPRPHSDLELFVIKAGIYHPFKVRLQLDRLFRDMSLPMDFLVLTPEQVTRELELGNTFLREQVLRKGKVLYERGG